MKYSNSSDIGKLILGGLVISIASIFTYKKYMRNNRIKGKLIDINNGLIKKEKFANKDIDDKISNTQDLDNIKSNTINEISKRHEQASKIVKESLKNIYNEEVVEDSVITENEIKINNMLNDLDKLSE